MKVETITIDTDKWVVVPRELTKAQEYAGCMNGIGPGVSKEVYDVLIAAAPRPEPVQQADFDTVQQLAFEIGEPHEDGDCYVFRSRLA